MARGDCGHLMGRR